MSLSQIDQQTLIYLIAALGFSLLFPLVSYIINRRMCGGHLDTDISKIVMLSSLVFVAAILCEAIVNPIYEAMYQHKLWEYRLLPIHDRNVSVLAIMVWTTYGIHLYFLNQTLERFLPAGSRRTPLKALIIGCEAPLLWEVLGNSYFLLTVGEFYAYYLPSDLWHLTSVQVVPIYIVAIFIGLLLYEGLKRRAPPWPAAAMLTAAGVTFLAVG